MSFNTKFLIGGPPNSGTSILSRILDKIDCTRVTQGLNLYGVKIDTPGKCELIWDPFEYFEDVSWRLAQYNESPQYEEFLAPILNKIMTINTPDAYNRCKLSVQIYRNLFKHVLNDNAGTEGYLREINKIHIHAQSAEELSTELKKTVRPKKLARVVRSVRELIHQNNDVSGDKLPVYGFVARKLYDIYHARNVKFIINIRHPLSVCRSMLDPKKDPEWWKTADKDKAFENMLKIFQSLQDSLKKLDEENSRGIFINRIEDFSLSPRNTLIRVIKFLSPDDISRLKYLPLPITKMILPKKSNYNPAFKFLENNFNYQDHDNFLDILDHPDIPPESRREYDKICHFFGYNSSLKNKQDLIKPKFSFKGSW